jgi:hypothetical protein
MRIQFFSIGMMVSIVTELQLRSINFECKVDDLGCGEIFLQEIRSHEVLAKIAA